MAILEYGIGGNEVKIDATENILKQILSVYENEEQLIFYYKQFNFWGTILNNRFLSFPDSIQIRKCTVSLPPDYIDIKGEIEYRKTTNPEKSTLYPDEKYHI